MSLLLHPLHTVRAAPQSPLRPCRTIDRVRAEGRQNLDQVAEGSRQRGGRSLTMALSPCYLVLCRLPGSVRDSQGESVGFLTRMS